MTKDKGKSSLRNIALRKFHAHNQMVSQRPDEVAFVHKGRIRLTKMTEFHKNLSHFRIKGTKNKKVNLKQNKRESGKEP